MKDLKRYCLALDLKDDPQLIEDQSERIELLRSEARRFARGSSKNSSDSA